MNGAASSSSSSSDAVATGVELAHISATSSSSSSSSASAAAAANNNAASSSSSFSASSFFSGSKSSVEPANFAAANNTGNKQASLEQQGLKDKLTKKQWAWIDHTLYFWLSKGGDLHVLVGLDLFNEISQETIDNYKVGGKGSEVQANLRICLLVKALEECFTEPVFKESLQKKLNQNPAVKKEIVNSPYTSGYGVPNEFVWLARAVLEEREAKVIDNIRGSALDKAWTIVAAEEKLQAAVNDNPESKEQETLRSMLRQKKWKEISSNLEAWFIEGKTLDTFMQPKFFNVMLTQALTAFKVKKPQSGWLICMLKHFSKGSYGRSLDAALAADSSLLGKLAHIGYVPPRSVDEESLEQKELKGMVKNKVGWEKIVAALDAWVMAGKNLCVLIKPEFFSEMLEKAVLDVASQQPFSRWALGTLRAYFVVAPFKELLNEALTKNLLASKKMALFQYTFPAPVAEAFAKYAGAIDTADAAAPRPM